MRRRIEETEASPHKMVINWHKELLRFIMMIIILLMRGFCESCSWYYTHSRTLYLKRCNSCFRAFRRTCRICPTKSGSRWNTTLAAYHCSHECILSAFSMISKTNIFSLYTHLTLHIFLAFHCESCKGMFLFRIDCKKEQNAATTRTFSKRAQRRALRRSSWNTFPIAKYPACFQNSGNEILCRVNLGHPKSNKFHLFLSNP